MDITPITLEVFKNKFATVAEEIGMSAEEAVSYGLIDKVLTSREPLAKKEPEQE